jgi:hypothetical protein
VGIFDRLYPLSEKPASTAGGGRVIGVTPNIQEYGQHRVISEIIPHITRTTTLE